jgi:hypothetical protein
MFNELKGKRAPDDKTEIKRRAYILHRADDSLSFTLQDTTESPFLHQAVVIAQGHDEFGQFFIRNAGAKLAVQRVGRRLPEREAVNFFDGLGELRRVEQHAFDLLGVAFQAFVCAETRAGGTPKLTANGFFLGDNKLDAFSDKLMMIFLPRRRGRVRQTFSGFENFKLRLGDVVAVLSRNVQENILWQDEKVFKPEASLPEPEPGRSGIPVFFKIPADQPPCSAAGAEPILWRLEASAKMSGPDFAVTFDVPVFRVAGAALATAEPEDPTIALQMPAEEIRRDEHSKIRVTDGPDGRDFYFPAARNVKSALGLTVFFLLWSGIVWFLFDKRAPWLFRITFSLVDGALACGCFNVWFHSSRITINATRVRLTHRRLIFSRTREFDSREIERFATKMGMTSGNQVLQDIKLVRRAGRDGFAARKALYQQTGQPPPVKFRMNDSAGITVASSIASQPEAEWLVQEMTKALGRRNN